jgi:hypothetical protein
MSVMLYIAQVYYWQDARMVVTRNLQPICEVGDDGHLTKRARTT